MVATYSPKRRVILNSSKQSHFLHARFFIGLIFDPEDWKDAFLRNISWFLTDYMPLYTRKLNSSNVLFINKLNK
jgi:hypothetical protein